MMQHNYGLVGALVIEPAGAKQPYDVDSNSRASATITKADGTKFREFVAVFHDDLAYLQSAYTYRLGAGNQNRLAQRGTFAGPPPQTGAPLATPPHVHPEAPIARTAHPDFHSL